MNSSSVYSREYVRLIGRLETKNLSDRNLLALTSSNLLSLFVIVVPMCVGRAECHIYSYGKNHLYLLPLVEKCTANVSSYS